MVCVYVCVGGGGRGQRWYNPHSMVYSQFSCIYAVFTNYPELPPPELMTERKRKLMADLARLTAQSRGFGRSVFAVSSF